MDDQLLTQALIKMMGTLETISNTQSAVIEGLNGLSASLRQNVSKPQVYKTAEIIEMNKKQEIDEDPKIAELRKLINSPVQLPDTVKIIEEVESSHYEPKFSKVQKSINIPGASELTDKVEFGPVSRM